MTSRSEVRVSRSRRPCAGRVDSGGAALLEFAIVLPLLALLIIWVGSLGLAISQLVWVSESSYAAAVAGAEDRSTSEDSAEGLFGRLFQLRHGVTGAALELRSNEASVVGTDIGGEPPLLSLSVALASKPMLGFLPTLDLGLTTVVSRLSIVGDVGDLSEPQNITGECPEGWQLSCGACGACPTEPDDPTDPPRIPPTVGSGADLLRWVDEYEIASSG